jgi:hypothetical protein
MEMNAMTNTVLIRGLLLGATAVALSGCYGGYDEGPAPTAYGYGYESGYSAYGDDYGSPYDYYYYDYRGHEDGRYELGPRGGKGL